jgi:hypothetical protein
MLLRKKYPFRTEEIKILTSIYDESVFFIF